MTNLKIKIGGLTLKNPVMVASGTFGYAGEFEGLADIKSLGAMVTKTITLKPRVGNRPPRIVETASGMLNSIGLENPGIEGFLKDKMPALKKYGVPVIVSIAGETLDEYGKLAKRLDGAAGVSGIEINVSCPNVGTDKLFAQSDEDTGRVVAAVRAATAKPLITKLSPNVTDITGIAKAAEEAGADAVSLINTLYAMSVDIDKRQSKLGNITGGLSGPAIKPIALLLVWRVYHSVKIPIIGMGGIMDWADAVEFILCGASAVAVGTANFVNPNAACEIVKGIEKYLKEHKISDINKLVGKLKI